MKAELVICDRCGKTFRFEHNPLKKTPGFYSFQVKDIDSPVCKNGKHRNEFHLCDQCVKEIFENAFERGVKK